MPVPQAEGTMSKIRRIPILLALLALLTAPVYAGSLTVTWDPNTEPDVVGYRVLYGTQSGVYTFSLAAGNVTTWTANNLNAGQTYYFVVQAVNAAGLTSPLSQEVSGMVPIGSTACAGVTATAPATGTVGSPVAFIALPSPAGCTGTVTYQWALGDGTSSTEGTASHTYYAAQSYTWTLSAMVDGAAVATQTGTIAVSDYACTPRTVVAAPPARAGVHPSAAMWQDMGMTVQAGDDLRITAVGTWRNGSQVLTAAGDGNQVVTGSNCPMSGAPLLALVARIGATGTPFLVQGGQAISVTTTGTLYLAPNDNWYTLWDNTGSLTVTLCSRQ